MDVPSPEVTLPISLLLMDAAFSVWLRASPAGRCAAPSEKRAAAHCGPGLQARPQITFCVRTRAPEQRGCRAVLAAVVHQLAMRPLGGTVGDITGRNGRAR
jgi:hypothetical protein